MFGVLCCVCSVLCRWINVCVCLCLLVCVCACLLLVVVCVFVVVFCNMLFILVRCGVVWCAMVGACCVGVPSLVVLLSVVELCIGIVC